MDNSLLLELCLNLMSLPKSINFKIYTILSQSYDYRLNQ